MSQTRPDVALSDLPRLKAPPGACDTHMHLYDARYPTARTAVLTPPDATVEEYRAVQRRLGSRARSSCSRRLRHRQPLHARRHRRARARGGARHRGRDRRETEGELEELTARGIRGDRASTCCAAALIRGMSSTASPPRCRASAGTCSSSSTGASCLSAKRRCGRGPATIVIDHIGKFLEPVRSDHPAFLSLAGLVESGRVWVKLSAMYEVSKAGGRSTKMSGASRRRSSAGPRAHALGQELAPPGPSAAGRGRPARHAARLGAGRGDAAPDLGRQSRGALRVLRPPLPEGEVGLRHILPAIDLDDLARHVAAHRSEAR